MAEPASALRFTVVVASHNEGDNLSRTVDSLLATIPDDSEIIVVDDMSTDGSPNRVNQDDARVTILCPPERLGVPRARNLGARVAKGSILVFSDAHVETPPGWWARLTTLAARSEVGCVGPAIYSLHDSTSKGYGFRWRDAAMNIEWVACESDAPQPVPMLCGCFTAMRREVFDATEGFDSGLVTWGMEDAEMSLRLWTRGYECLVEPRVEIGHLFRPTHPYAVPWVDILHNQLRVGVIHFGVERLSRLIAALSVHDTFPAAMARVVHSDVWQRRARVRAVRRHDDDWYCDRFGLAV